MRFAPLATLLFAAVLRVSAQTADPSKVAQIIASLADITTNAERFNTFNGREFVFDFNAGVGVTGGAGGNLTVADVSDFPYLFGKGMALSVGRLAPCGLASPHYHPRSSEFLYMLSGQSLQTGFILENGARYVSGILTPNQAFLYPQNSFHYQANLNCDYVTFVAGFNNEDPGYATVGQRFFGIPPNVTDVTLGDIGLNETIRIAQGIPDSFAIGVQSCLTKCNIQNTTAQPKTQQQPRVLGNGFDTNSARKRSGEPSKRSEEAVRVLKRSVGIQEQEEQVVATPATMSSILSSVNPQTIGELVFLLKIVIGVMLAGYVFTWAYFVVPTWKYRRMQAQLEAQAAASSYARLQDDKA